MKNSKILITGGQGMLGGYFSEVFGDRALTVGRRQLDIGDSERFREILIDEHVGCVINAAGGASGDQEQLNSVNAFFPAELARIASEREIPFVFLSSGRVFDGSGKSPFTEDSLPGPRDDYGRSKYLGEKMVRRACGKSVHYIIRLPMVLGYRSRNPTAQVVNRLMLEARKRGTVSVANDVFHSPVYAGSVARMIKCLIDGESPAGFYHASNGERVSLHELIQWIFMKLNIQARVVPVAAKSFGSDHGPLNLALGTVKSSMDEAWTEAADRFAAEFKRKSGSQLA